MMESTSTNMETTSLRRTTSVRSAVSGTSDENIPFINQVSAYEILDFIGCGASAEVYSARFKADGKKVAIKIIDLDAFERSQIDQLRREIQNLSLCKHPNILRVYGSFVEDTKLYIVTPYLAGGSCLDIMKAAHPDGLEETIITTILKQTLQGLVYLHKQGLIHRDVKAGNLLLDSDGTVLLADFGVSSSLMETGERGCQRKTFVGTPCWMAPEVMEQSPYDTKADIWSFGITCLELANGNAPYSKFLPLKVLMLTLNHDPPTLDRDKTKHKYSKTFKEMIDMCLQKDPTKRPSAERLLQHKFFANAKKPSYLCTHLLKDLPPLEKRQHKVPVQKAKVVPKGISWDFSDESSSSVRFEKRVNETGVRKSRFVIHEADVDEDTSSEKVMSSPDLDVKAPLPPADDARAPEIRRGRFAVIEGSDEEDMAGVEASMKSLGIVQPSTTSHGDLALSGEIRFESVGMSRENSQSSATAQLFGGAIPMSRESSSRSRRNAPSETSSRRGRFEVTSDDDDLNDEDDEHGTVPLECPPPLMHPTTSSSPTNAPHGLAYYSGTNDILSSMNTQLNVLLQQNEAQQDMLSMLCHHFGIHRNDTSDTHAPSHPLEALRTLEQQMVALMQENARLRSENESLRAQLDDLQQMFAAEPTPHLTATSQVPPFPDEKPPL